MSERNGSDFLAGFLLGALAGTALALLFAPEPGEKTREYLKEQTIELKGRAGDLSGKAREQAEELTARGRIVLEERVAQLEEAVAEGKKAAERTSKELRGKLEEARSPEKA